MAKYFTYEVWIDQKTSNKIKLDVVQLLVSCDGGRRLVDGLCQQHVHI
jgi:hypothetical protein